MTNNIKSTPERMNTQANGLRRDFFTDIGGIIAYGMFTCKGFIRGKIKKL